MPDKKRTPTLTRELNPTEQEFNDFIDWVMQIYGPSAAFGFSINTYQQTPTYAWWTSQRGIPGAGMPPGPAQPSIQGAGPEVEVPWMRKASGVDDTALALLQGGGGATQTPAYGSQLPPSGMPSWPTGPEMEPAPGEGSDIFQAWMGAGQFGEGGAWSVPGGRTQEITTGLYRDPASIPDMYRTPEWEIQTGYDQDPETGDKRPFWAVVPNTQYRTDLINQAMASQGKQAQAFYTSFNQQRQYELAQQKMQQEAAQVKAQQDIEKQKYLAQLAANPQSWLQYAAAGGGVPTIQPWMQPLMQPGYQIASRGGDAAYTVTAQDIQAGKPIPGYGMVPFESGGVGYATEPGPGGVPTRVETEDYIWREAPYWSKPGHESSYRWTAPSGTMDYSKLPQLQMPDRAYWEGMGPTGQSQYLGYEKARTGAPGLETLWRLPWEQTKRALPSGGGMSLSYRR